jgi:hypothetical protein
VIDTGKLKRNFHDRLATAMAEREQQAKAEGKVLTSHYWDAYRLSFTKAYAENQMAMAAQEVDTRYGDTAENGAKAGNEFGEACATIAVTLGLSKDDGEEAMHAARKRHFVVSTD